MGENKELRVGVSSKVQFDGGICYGDESNIELSQSPYGGLLNMCLDDGGMPTKRMGQQYMCESYGDKGIKGLYPNYKGKIIFASDVNLYSLGDNGIPVMVHSGLSGNDVFMFTYNAILYVIDGVNFYRYDGNKFKIVVPYVPRVTMNRKPDGSSSSVDESWNMIGNKFKDSFNGDGASKTYKLSLFPLDAGSTVECYVNGARTSSFTVDLNTGIVTFNTAPSSGNNNVEIVAVKTFNGLKDNILKCKFGIEFSNRMFLGGNDNLPNFYFAGGLSDNNDASYFPQKYQYSIKGSDKAVTGFKVHYNKLVVFKEDMTCTVTAATGLDNEASFPIEFLNTDIGCDIPDSIQLINNNIVFANTYGGVHMIVSTDVIGEKAIVSISDNINGSYDRPGLLYEDKIGLKKACSADHGNKYYLCVNGRCYVWDYKGTYNVNYPDKLKWFIYDNVFAKKFGVKNNELFYGHSKKDILCKFIESKNDFGDPINGVFKTKLIDFGYPDWFKTVSYIWYTCKANSASEVKINYFNDEGNIINSELIPASELTSFNWGRFNWGKFNWIVKTFSPTLRLKVKLKKIKYFQIELINNKVNENLSIINLVIRYNLTRKVK